MHTVPLSGIIRYNQGHLSSSPSESSLFRYLPHDFDNAFEGGGVGDVEDEDEPVARRDIEALHGREFELPRRVEEIYTDLDA